MKSIGWIGTGVMGKSMCGHLIDKGYTCYVYNRTEEKTKDLIEKGAILCKNPAEVAQKTDIIFSIVGYPKDVEEIMLGEKGVFSTIKDGATIIDMTTSTPTLAKELFNKGKERGVSVLDAPVSGGDIGAREARLSIMVGGEEESFNKILPLFEIMGKNIIYTGTAGMGQHTKMANQISVAATTIGTCETLLYSQKAGLDLTTTIKVIGAGAGSSWSLINLGPKILDGNFNPGFFIKHFLKDMKIVLDECEKMNLSLPGLELVYQIYQKSQGYENFGTQALFRILKELNEEKKE
jgi:3-hydroxyisobutyrate dehydrogenase